MTDNIGTRVRQAREQRGLSLGDAARSTKLSTSVLRAIEQNDFASLPAGMYRKAYLRTVASEVGLDPLEIAADYEAQYEAPIESTAPATQTVSIADRWVELLQPPRRPGIALLIAMFPQISLVSPLFNIERTLGLFDTWLGLIIPYMTFALPLAIYTLSAFFREIPWDLEKAAKMDGATPFQAFRRVIAPLAAPGIFTAAILVFIFCWNDFLFAISLTSTVNSRTVPAAIAFFTGSSQFEQPTGSIAAAAVVITIPIVLFVVFFQRRIVSGLTSGAVKG